MNEYRYGPAPSNKDSAVNILLDVVADQSGKQYKMDHYATRFPTNVLDIADFLVRLTSRCSSIIFGPTLTSLSICRRGSYSGYSPNPTLLCC